MKVEEELDPHIIRLPVTDWLAFEKFGGLCLNLP